jgi:hypothetical protein
MLTRAGALQQATFSRVASLNADASSWRQAGVNLGRRYSFASPLLMLRAGYPRQIRHSEDAFVSMDEHGLRTCSRWHVQFLHQGCIGLD